MRGSDEQSRHDSVIAILADQLREVRHKVKTNLGNSKGNPVARGDGKYYPDIYIYEDSFIKRIYEVETEQTVNAGAIDQWKQYSVGADFYLVVPKESLEAVKRLVQRSDIDVEDYLTF